MLHCRIYSANDVVGENVKMKRRKNRGKNAFECRPVCRLCQLHLCSFSDAFDNVYPISLPLYITRVYIIT